MTSHPQWQLDPLDHLGLSPLVSPPVTRALVLLIVGIVTVTLSSLELLTPGPLRSTGFVTLAGFLPGVAVWIPATLVTATALLTAWLGMQMRSARLGLLAGLIVAVNPAMMMMARSDPQGLLATFVMLLSFTCFVSYYLDGSRPALLLCYTAVGLSGLAPHPLGLIGPLGIFALFLMVTREREVWRRWFSWAGLALLLMASLPSHLVLEGPPGATEWPALREALGAYLRAIARPAVPDGAATWLVSLGSIAAGFLPWCLVLPYALATTVARPVGTRTNNPWLLMTLWITAVLLLTATPALRHPHLALVTFPQMALLAAYVWDDVMHGAPRAPSPHLLVAPALVVIGGMGLVLFGAGPWMRGAAGAWVTPLAERALLALSAPDLGASWIFGALRSRQAELAMICWFGSLGLAVALIQRRAAVAFLVLLAVTTACLMTLGTGKWEAGSIRGTPERAAGRGGETRHGHGADRAGERVRSGTAERTLDSSLGLGGEAGGGRGRSLGLEAVRIAVERVVDEPQVVLVAPTEHTHHEVGAQPQALPQGQPTVEGLRHQRPHVAAGIEQRVQRPDHEQRHHDLTALPSVRA